MREMEMKFFNSSRQANNMIINGDQQ